LQSLLHNHFLGLISIDSSAVAYHQTNTVSGSIIHCYRNALSSDPHRFRYSLLQLPKGPIVCVKLFIDRLTKVSRGSANGKTAHGQNERTFFEVQISSRCLCQRTRKKIYGRWI